ncbi:hypothetical protein K7640_23135 [Micromonospora sp. PLK6-60]|uniref:hypothetical protein n=1 Tax=Micromonospora sp. PLK6-60 TaxID=2873383 RepID=UPI001CA795D6|nr:hypothetical protein [Micromonospora sp. PLK6-60]MBY8874727.1 hypothetical protein [Micromonospora sp. PLK6-60]
MIGTLVTTLALVCAVVALVTSRSWRAALRVLLDLLTAAGLLRLTVDQGWTELAGAALIIMVRRLLWAVLATGPPALFRRSGGGNDHGLTWRHGETGYNGRNTA